MASKRFSVSSCVVLGALLLSLSGCAAPSKDAACSTLDEAGLALSSALTSVDLSGDPDEAALTELNAEVDAQLAEIEKIAAPAELRELIDQWTAGGDDIKAAVSSGDQQTMYEGMASFFAPVQDIAEFCDW